MAEEHNFLPKVNKCDLVKASKYIWIYIPLFITDDMYNNYREIMPKLNTSQQTLLTFYLFNESMCSGSSNPTENVSINGGFLTSIYNGYGEYIFEAPFSEILKSWRCTHISRIVDKAKIIYKGHKNELKKAKTLKQLFELFSKSEIKDFIILDNEYMERSHCEIEIIRNYIENNIDEFAIIDESNSQVSYIDISIKEMAERKRSFEDFDTIIKYVKENIDALEINNENNTVVIRESAIFEKKGTKASEVNMEINGRRICIKILKRTC